MDILWDMIPPNVKRNKVISELLEEGLTVDQISSRTGIPRSTVGYYVRKFNKLAVEGKPIVIPRERRVESAHRDSPFSAFQKVAKDMIGISARKNILTMLHDGKYQELYYFLMDLKLMKELDSTVISETIEKLVKP